MPIDNAKNLHHRRSIRLQGFDYTSENGYFVTMVTQGRVNLFGEIRDDEIVLNEMGKIAAEEWFKTKELRPYVELLEDEFVVMPNHIHGIIWIVDAVGTIDIHGSRGTALLTEKSDIHGKGTARRAPTNDHDRAPTTVIAQTHERFGKPVQGSLPTIVRAYKSAVTKRINLLRGIPGTPVFQRNYYEHIIGTEREYDQIAAYIANNPVNWILDNERFA